MYCNSCGAPLGDPEEDLHDPDNLMQIVEGGVENQSSHLKAQDTAKGPRLFCRPTGKMTKIVEDPPDEEPPEPPSGGDQDSGPNEQPKPQPKADEVYDIDEDKSAEDLIAQICSNEVYGLNDSQIMEMRDWVDIYDGRIPPDRFEEILRDFEGISKQKSRLMRTKYEVMLDRELRKQADDRGPSIGASASIPRAPQQGGPQSPPQGGASARPQPPPSTPSDNGTGGSADGDLREERRKRRIDRRNDALDTAAEQFADAAAKEMAQDFGGFFGDAREILYTVFKKKAENDPDWFFEKAEQWDVEILDAVLEPSERRKQELKSSEKSAPAVDSEIDEALQELDEEEGEIDLGEETFMEEPGPEEDEEEHNDRIELDDVMET